MASYSNPAAQIGANVGSFVLPKPKPKVPTFNTTANNLARYPTRPVAPVPPPPISQGVFYGATGSGGGGGGGGGGGAAATPVTPTKLSKFNLDEIKAALDAISANYGYEEKGLLGQRDSLHRAFELLQADQNKQRDQTLMETKAKASGSGRIRSGLFLKDQSRISDSFADALIRARAQNDSQLAPIQQQIGNIDAREAAARAAEARRIANEMVGTQEALAQALKLV